MRPYFDRLTRQLINYLFLHYFYSKSTDGKVNCNFVVHFSKIGTEAVHLGVLEKKIASGKLGKLTVDKTLTKKSELSC